MTEIEFVSVVVKRPLENKVNDANEKANFDFVFVELVYLKTLETKKMIFISLLMTEIGIASVVVKRP